MTTSKLARKKFASKLCSVEAFHSKKEQDKIDYLNGLTPEEKNKLLEDQQKSFTFELKKTLATISLNIDEIQGHDGGDDSIHLILDDYLSKWKWANKKIQYPITPKKQSSIFQYTIFYCELGENIGYEKNKTRPVLVLSKKPHLDNLVIVAPITTTNVSNGIPINETKFNKINGFLDLQHIRAVDKNRLDEKAIDRLLFASEYVDLSTEKGITIVPIQETIARKFKNLI